MIGELDIHGPSEVPAYIGSWPLQEKAQVFSKWLEDNFERESVSDYIVWFADFDNNLELELEFEGHGGSTRNLLKEAWGLFVSVDE